MDGNKYIIYTTSSLNRVEQTDVLKINNENLYKNGGELHYAGILPYNYAVLVKYDSHIVGYALLASSYFLDNDMYVMQVAIDKKFQHKHLGSCLYKYIFNYLNGYEFITSNARPENTVSCNFHKKMGFSVVGQNGDGYIFAKQVHDAQKTFAEAKPLAIPKKYLKTEKEINC